jgi:hypothetical protein
MMEHHFSQGRDLLPSIRMPVGAILRGSPALKEWQKSARLPPPVVLAPHSITRGRPRPTGANFPRGTLLLGGGRCKSDAGEAYMS